MAAAALHAAVAASPAAVAASLCDGSQGREVGGQAGRPMGCT